MLEDIAILTGGQAISSSSDFPEAVSDTVKRIDHVEGIIDRRKLSTYSLDMAVDCAVVDVNVIVICRIHERVSTLDHTWTAHERLQN